jgi:hypothetical protein
VNTSLSKLACAIGLHDAKLEYHDGENISSLVHIGDTAIHTPPPILRNTHTLLDHHLPRNAVYSHKVPERKEKEKRNKKE